MPSPADREKSLETALAQIDRQFGKGSVMRLGSDERAPVAVIPTGSVALDVALGILGRPSLLFLDEPTTGFDPHARREFHELIHRLADLEGAPVMVGDKKIAWPSQLAIGSDGMGNSLDHILEIMGSSMEALIHHFKLVTEGFRVPAGQTYQAVESARGEMGVHLVSDGGTKPYRCHFRDPSFNNLQAVAAMCEGGSVADVIVAVASIDPVMGGVDR